MRDRDGDFLNVGVKIIDRLKILNPSPIHCQAAEAEHKAIVVPNEESARTYFNLRQQLAKLQKTIVSYIHKPR